jgi:hypothetical protein
MLLIPESIACMPEAQRGDAADVHLVDRGRRAAEDHLVELVGGEALARKQRAAGLRGEIGRAERPGTVLGLEERRARAVEDVDRPGEHLRPPSS